MLRLTRFQLFFLLVLRARHGGLSLSAALDRFGPDVRPAVDRMIALGLIRPTRFGRLRLTRSGLDAIDRDLPDMEGAWLAAALADADDCLPDTDNPPVHPFISNLRVGLVLIAALILVACVCKIAC